MKTYQDQFDCPACGKETLHDVTDGEHERDMSNDRRECTVCHFYWSGLTDRYYSPEGYVGKAVLFLDFDGVLNDEDYIQNALKDSGRIAVYSIELAQKTLDPVRVSRVQGLCDVTGADVVLVTGWRRWAGLEELRAALTFAGFTAPVIDVVGGVKMSGDLRRWATVEWLKDHPQYTRHVIIDDAENLWVDWGKKGAVLNCIHPIDGIEEKHVLAAIGILGKKEGAA